MKITFVRHSQTILQPEVPNPLWQLSDEGIQLSQELSKNGAIKDLDVIYSSLQTKALQTTLLLAKDNHIPIKTHSDLTELTSITIKFFSDYEEKVKALYTGEIDQINGGETIEEGKTRLNKAIEEIANTEEPENIGIVAHGNILSIFASQFVDKTAYEIHQQIQMPDYAIFDYDAKKFLKFYGE
ncbi:hypothetical protein GF389_01070 [Candidatus Dojkabacteria bacterium]|nr:hypothetical protein [Candidatus Dojkabacteria bacterium]